MSDLLKNHQVKCIISALDIEFHAIVKRIGIETKNISMVSGEYIVAESFERRLIVARAGIGKEKANQCAETLYEIYPYISCYISVGLAGSISDQLIVGDILISDCIIDEEKGKYETKNIQIKNILLDIKDNTVKCGSVLCSNEIIKDTKKKQYLFEKYRAHCVEMESSGIVHFAQKKGIPFLAIKVISDLANEAAISSIIRSYEKTCNSLACYIDHIIDDILIN